MTSKLIVYACPTGPLANQIDAYYTRSQELYGRNAAHAYPPHCTLTGFFHDDADSIPRYAAALAAALERARPMQPAPAVTITRLELHEHFHGLVLESPWLINLTADFAATADSPTRRDDLRLKDWLHLSLAYAFPPEQHTPLARLAGDLVDISAPVGWELRLYEQLPAGGWNCHAHWRIADPHH